MFSLIITIVSVALVAALAVATIFYGGDALTRGQAAARAAAVVNGGEQIMAAVALYRSDRGQVPPTLETLRTEGYLNGFPDLAHSTGFELVSSAYAAPVDGAGDWLYDHDAPHLAFVGELSMEACAEVNRLVSERRIVLNRLDPDPHAQCVVKGAQAPVAVFRHPGEGFDNWTDHPQIPEPTSPGTIKRPDLGTDICVYGCENAGGAPTEPEVPTEPEGGEGAQVQMIGPSLASLIAETCDPENGWQGPEDPLCAQSHGNTSLPYWDASPSGTELGGWYGMTCVPIIASFAEMYHWTVDPQSGEVRVNGEALTSIEDALARLGGISVTGRLVDIAPLPDVPLYLGVFDGENWTTYPSSTTVTTAYPADLSTIGFKTEMSVNGSPVEEGDPFRLTGELGLCADVPYGTSPFTPTHRLELTFSRNGDSSSASIFIMPGAW